MRMFVCLFTLSMFALGARAQTKSVPPKESAHLEGVGILVAADRVVLDGKLVVVPELAGALAEIQRNHKTLHPAQPWPGQCIVVADASLPFSKIGAVLESVTKSGCPNVALRVKEKASNDDIARLRGMLK